jgi:hypothetical protein
MESVRAPRITLYGGLSVLLVGVLLAARTPSVPVDGALESLSDRHLATTSDAVPAFDLTYAMMDLKVYRQLTGGEPPASNADFSSLSYPAVQNAVSSRIATDSPPLRPDFNRIPPSDFFTKEFVHSYRRGKLSSPDVSVACLIVKQTGKGRADAPIIEVDRVDMRRIAEVFDPLDIGVGDNPGNLRRAKARVTRERMQLPSMDTGEGAIVPLYVTNLFRRLDGEGGYQVTTHTAYVPIALVYQAKGATEQVAMDHVLGRPLLLGGGG